MQRIYIIKVGEISYDDQYYYFNTHDTHGDICDVYCFIDKALTVAKAYANSLYQEYSNQLDDIDWDQYSYTDEDELLLSTIEGKLSVLKKLCYKLVTIEVYDNPTIDGKLQFNKSIPITIDLDYEIYCN